MEIQRTQNIGFKAMKPNQFKGFDYACVRRFKAPVEKFNTKENLYGWALDKLNNYIKEKCMFGKSAFTSVRRSEGIFEWRNQVGFGFEKAPLALIVFTSILKDLKPNNDKLPPILSIDTFEKTISELESKLSDDKDFQFNFGEIYDKNLKTILNDSCDPNYSGWIKIPSKDNDPKNFKNNAAKLKILSSKTWCTKNYHADIVLTLGDFYVLMENGKPKVGLRFDNDTLCEIQSDRNDGVLDIEYFEKVNDFILKKRVALIDKALYTYHKTKDIVTRKAELMARIQNPDDPLSILQNLGFEPEILEDGTISINSYFQPSEIFNFKETGIDENSLFKDVSEIRGDADFNGSCLTKLNKIKQIHGSADFYGSEITDLGALETIKGDANFDFSKVTSLGNLKEVGGSCSLLHTAIENIDKLEHVGKNLDINTFIEKLPENLVVKGDIRIF